MQRLESPINSLLVQWHGQKPPPFKIISQYRAQLLRVAADEIEFQARSGLTYDPNADCRYIWATQWLDVANGTRHRLDIGVSDSAAFLLGLTQPVLSRQHLAAADNF